MTFLTTHYRLTRTLAPRDFQNLHRLSTVYGIRRLHVEGRRLVVEYDASRMHEAEVLAEVRKVGIAVEPEEPIPPGSFDYTGEFRDFDWPTQGLTPVNQG